MSFQIGDKIRLTATFRDVGRFLADPDTVRFRFKQECNAETAYVYLTDSQIVRDSVGVFHVDLALTAQGEWWFRWEGDGTLAGAIEKALEVDPSKFDVT